MTGAEFTLIFPNILFITVSHVGLPEDDPHSSVYYDVAFELVFSYEDNNPAYVTQEVADVFEVNL